MSNKLSALCICVHCNNAIVILNILFVIWVARYGYDGIVNASLETGVTKYCNNWSCYKGWDIYLGHRYFMSTSAVVYMTRIIVREQCHFAAIALILSLSKLPALVAFSCSCSYSMCTVLPIAGCHKGLLVSSHKTMSTVAILVRNTIVKITNTFLQCASTVFIFAKGIMITVLAMLLLLWVHYALLRINVQLLASNSKTASSMSMCLWALNVHELL